MLNVDMSEVMEKLPLEEEVKNALVGMQGPYASFLRIAIAYERNQARQLMEQLKNVGIEPSIISNRYLEAIQYAKGLLL
jgi:EAL and modified HD-GYP domain-containing signal transduction protein